MIRLLLRRLWRSPGFAMTAIVAIGLGVGVNTAIFTVVDATLFKPLPYERPEELVRLGHRVRAGTAMETIMVGISWDEIETWRAETTIFQGIEGAAGGRARHWRETSQPLITGSFTPGLPALLGVRPLRGRVFSHEESDSAAPVVVIAEPLWSSAFSRRADIVGTTMTIDNRAHTIIGVMPGLFRYGPGGGGVILAWTGLSSRSGQRPSGGNTFFRLRTGLTLESAQQLANAVAERMQQAAPSKEPWTVQLLSVVEGRKEARASFFSPMLLLLGSAGVVLLVACVSVGNLLWTRSDSRRQELETRAMLGASRAQLARLVIAEGFAVAILGGLLAVVAARWTLAVVVLIVPSTMGRQMFFVSAPEFDWRVLLFAIGVTTLVAVLSVVWPAVAASRAGFRPLAGRQIAGLTGARRRASQAVQAVQIALAFVLATTAGLFTTSLVTALTADRGFNPRGLGVVSFSVPDGRYRTAEAQRLARDEVLRYVRALPMVRHVAVGPSPPSTMAAGMALPGGMSRVASLALRDVGPGYFEAAGIPLVAGRDFDASDTPTSPRVAIIDEAGARRVFGHESPIGKRFTYSPYVPEHTIIGVVGTVAASDFIEGGHRVGMYLADGQNSPGTSFLIRSDRDLDATLKEVRSAIEAAEPGARVFSGTAQDAYEGAETFAAPRFYVVLVSTFAALALVTAAVGLYGLVAYSVGQRTREIGLRLALGSTLGGIRSLVLSEALVTVAAGLAVGALATWWLTGVAESLLYGISPRDPRAFAAGATVLLLAAFVAVTAPMRRASRIDPLIALRAE